MLGTHVPLEEAEAILKRLNFHVKVLGDGAWDVLPPVFRLDVTIPEDLVEEVGRVYGYDRVPPTLPGRRHDTWTPLAQSVDRRLDVAREVMSGAGSTETSNPALVSGRKLEGLRVAIGPQLVRYVVEKGSIALSGVSLTVTELGTGWAEVSLIPETLAATTLGEVSAGERLNVECDLVAKYVERLVAPCGGKERT